MALEGTLKDFSLADIFQLIGLQRKTGILTLQSEIDTVTVIFLDGKIVGAESVEKKLEDRLGRVLVKRGYIDDAQLQQALETQRETLQRLGYILIKNNVISPEELKKALHDQINQIIFRLFRWKEGYYHFRQEKTVHYDKENIIPMSAENILMAGVQIVDEWPRIQKKIPNFDIVFKKKKLPPGTRIVTSNEEEADFTLLEEAIEEVEEVVEEKDDNVITLTRESELAYALVDSERNVQAIIDACHQGEFETLKALYSLLEDGLIEFTGEQLPEKVEEEKEARSYEGVREKLVYGIVLVALLAIFFFFPINPVNVFINAIDSISQVFNPTVVKAPNFLREINHLKIDKIHFAIKIFYLENHSLPKNLDLLSSKKYINKKDLLDMWGNPFILDDVPDVIQIRSKGPDGIAKTDDDIIVEDQLADDVNEAIFFPIAT